MPTSYALPVTIYNIFNLRNAIISLIKILFISERQITSILKHYECVFIIMFLLRYGMIVIAISNWWPQLVLTRYEKFCAPLN